VCVCVCVFFTTYSTAYSTAYFTAYFTSYFSAEQLQRVDAALKVSFASIVGLFSSCNGSLFLSNYNASMLPSRSLCVCACARVCVCACV